jgi:mannose-6-phosphate isomerase-like protein (cupin superfamily)
MTHETRSLIKPDESAVLADGSTLDTIRMENGLTVSKAVLQPGWNYADHVRPLSGTETCQAPHQQVVIAGTAHVKEDDGTEFDVGPGDVYTASPGHTAWVTGDEPLIAFDVSFAGQPSLADTLNS